MKCSPTSARPARAGLFAGAMLPVAILAAALIASLFAGCPSTGGGEVDGGPPIGFCETRAECTEGQICTDDKRCADCQTSGECSLKEECRIDADAGTQRCALRSGWGSDCALNSECPAGRWCVQGLCKDSSEVRLCPGGTGDECLATERCNQVNLVCEENLGCTANGDCAAVEVCNLGLRSCVPRCTLENQSTVCAGAERCVNEMCVQCERDTDCGLGLFCDPAGRCVAQAQCYGDRDCRVPQVCHIPTGTCVDKPPPCASDESCAPDERCNIGTGKCIPRDCQPDRFEPNDDVATAKTVTATRHIDLTLCAQDLDLYAFTMSRGDRLAVTVDADPFAEDTFSTLIQDATGRTVASGRFIAQYVASVPDVYYVSISTTDPYQPYDVNFLMSRGTPCDDDTWEPNDLPGQATPVNQAGLVGGAICPQDADHFSTAVPTGKALRVSLIDYASSGGLLNLCVFDGATQLGCSDDPGTPMVTATVAQVGGKTAMVRVKGGDERTANTYTLNVEFL